jgi:hypothetical protein
MEFRHTSLENGFQVMGKVSKEYNCLGWAIQSRSFLNNESLFEDIGKAVAFMETRGFELTEDQTVADIDVWAAKDWQTGGLEITHFSRKTEFGWTSKLGYDMLIVHGRYDFECLHDDEEGTYGEIMYHFKRKNGVAEQQGISLQEVCALAKCDCSSNKLGCCSRNRKIAGKL